LAADRYGHLFPGGDDAAERAFMTVKSDDRAVAGELGGSTKALTEPVV
jgi:hypothetical protein